MDTRFRASPRHSGARKFFLIFSDQSAAGASLRGRRHSSYLNNNKKYHLCIMDECYNFHRKRICVTNLGKHET